MLIVSPSISISAALTGRLNLPGPALPASLKDPQHARAQEPVRVGYNTDYFLTHRSPVLL